MPTHDEAAIRQLIDDMAAAWNRGDAPAYGARYRADGTFTNVNGTFHDGREAFDRRHEEVLRGPFKGTTVSMTIRKLRFLGPDVAVADIDTAITGCRAKWPGAEPDADGVLHTGLLMVLARQAGDWWIAAYHNVWRAAAR